MSSQTKLLSAATVLSTLSDNDKIAVVTEAGATGLVTSKVLKNTVRPLIESSGDASEGGKWLRIAMGDKPTTCGIIYIQSRHWNDNQRGCIIAVDAPYPNAGPRVQPILSGGISKIRVVMIEMSDASPVAIDILLPTGYLYRNLSVTCSGGFYAINPILEPSVEGARYAIEFNVGGGRNHLIYNPLKAVKAERRAA